MFLAVLFVVVSYRYRVPKEKLGNKQNGLRFIYTEVSVQQTPCLILGVIRNRAWVSSVYNSATCTVRSPIPPVLYYLETEKYTG